jgi:ribosomal-protein-alanine N-acetyltransferase
MREATTADAAELAALHAAAFDHPWSTDAFRGFLQDPTIAAALIETKGFILWRSVAGEAEILTLAVAPSERRQGLASALLNAALDGATATGAEAVFLEVADRNLAAVGLYRAAGFETTGLRRGYYESENQPQDALTMRLSLTAARAATITANNSQTQRG